MRKLAFFLSFFLAATLILMLEKPEQQNYRPSIPFVQPEIIKPTPIPQPPHISVELPPYLSYSQITNRLLKWRDEAKDYVEVGTYGYGTGTEIYYIRLTNKLSQSKKPKILLTGAIHGNEQWSTCIVMGCAGTILNKHLKLLDSYDIYIIPSVCPMTYGRQRELQGLDPNRNFKNPSLPPILAIQQLFLENNFDAVLSGHTSGRVIMYPPGDSYSRPNPKHVALCEKMAQLSGYQTRQLCYAYPHLIHGTETDWYAAHGATAFVVEIGYHMNAPSYEEIKSEFKRLFPAYLYFIQQSKISRPLEPTS